MGNCAYGNGGKHPKGLRGCGCSEDPDRASGGSGGAGRGGKSPSGGAHRHVYKTVRTSTRDYTVWEGLRRKKYRDTYYFEHCDEPNCPQPDRVVVHTTER